MKWICFREMRSGEREYYGGTPGNADPEATPWTFDKSKAIRFDTPSAAGALANEQLCRVEDVDE